MKAQIGSRNLIFIIIVVCVIAIITIGLIRFDIVNLLDRIIPGGKPAATNKTTIETETYLNRNGICKPFEGIYRLNADKEIELLYNNNWINVDNNALTQSEYEAKKLQEEIKTTLIEAKEQLSLEFESNNYKINLVEKGLTIELDGSTYIYSYQPNSADKNNLRNITTYETGEITGPIYPDILNRFNEVEEARFRSLVKAFINVAREEKINFKNEQTSPKLFITYENIDYGIDYKNDLFIYENKLWKQINFDENYELTKMKEKLTEACNE